MEGDQVAANAVANAGEKPAEANTAFAKAPEQIVTPASEAIKAAVVVPEPDEKYKGIQRVVAQKDQEIATLRRELEEAKSTGATSEELAAIRLEIAEVRDAQAARLAEETGETPKQSYAEKERANYATRIQNVKAQNIANMLNQAGYGANHPAFKLAADLWQEGEKTKNPEKFAQSEEYIKTALTYLPPKANANPVQSQQPENIEALINQRAEILAAEKIAAQQKINPALLKVELGNPSNAEVANLSADKLRKAFTENPYDPAIRAKYFAWKATQG